MKPVIEFDGATVFHGSNLDVLPFMADNSVDSIVTDPPYELGFMGKKWDSTGIAYSVELWQECLRVLKPGGHLLAFGGSRTWHRLAVAIEDAGFEMRDSIAWLYGAGFPKSLDISKAIDKAAGAERVSLGRNPNSRENATKANTLYESGTVGKTAEITAPATPEAQKWQGWGTALKPAFEPVVVARKPLIGTVAQNVLEWGVGGLNIDASRIGTEERVNQPAGNKAGGSSYNLSVTGMPTDTTSTIAMGRWPANIVLDEFTAELLDQQSGFSKSTGVINRFKSGAKPFGGAVGEDYESVQGVADSGGASRFFYVAKANKKDRNEGLEELQPRLQMNAEFRPNHLEKALEGDAGKPHGRYTPTQNFHPTVKPTDLMRYLIKLVTPAGGIVLDPFTGSGSTGKAALLDGYQFIGIELTEEYLPIIEGRLKWATENKNTERKLF